MSTDRYASSPLTVLLEWTVRKTEAVVFWGRESNQVDRNASAIEEDTYASDYAEVSGLAPHILTLKGKSLYLILLGTWLLVLSFKKKKNPIFGAFPCFILSPYCPLLFHLPFPKGHTVLVGKSAGAGPEVVF